MAAQQDNEKTYGRKARRNQHGRLLLGLVVMAALTTDFLYRSVQQGKLNHALFVAVATSDVSDALSLIRRGANPNARQVYEITPATPLQAVQWVVRSPKIFYYNEPILVEASISGQVAVVEALLDAGADIDARNQYGWTALIGAVGRHRTDVARVLLHRGAAIHLRSNNGVTPLKIAEHLQDAEIVQMLKQAGAKD